MRTALDDEIARLTGAFRLHRAFIGGGWGIVGALAALLTAAIMARIIPLWQHPALLLLAVWVVGGGTLPGALLGYVWPVPLPRRLRLFDRRFNLAERLTTAWELSQGRIHAPSAIAHLQLEETMLAVQSIAPQTVFPLRPPRPVALLALALIVGLLPAIFLPNPQEDVLARRAAQREATAAAIAQLEATRQALADDTTLPTEKRAAALKALDEALAILHDQHSTPTEQSAALSEAERQLAALRSPEAAAQLQRLAEATPLSTAEIVRPLAEALQQGDAEAAASYLRSLTDSTNKHPLTAEELLALADAFAQMAEALQTTAPTLAEQFATIAREIYSGDLASAAEAVQQAAELLTETAQANVPNQTLEQAQAGLQQAQEALGDAQRQKPGSDAPTQAAFSTGQGETGTGKPGAPAGAPSNGGDNTDGMAPGGHHEDTGSSSPYGTKEMPRLGEQGGEITLPRQETAGPPHTTLGVTGEARVPYEAVYTHYAEAARADLTHNAYPPALRAYVRKYFNELEP